MKHAQADARVIRPDRSGQLLSILRCQVCRLAPRKAQDTAVADPGIRAAHAAGGLPVAAIGIACWRSNSMCVTPLTGGQHMPQTSQACQVAEGNFSNVLHFCNTGLFKKTNRPAASPR